MATRNVVDTSLSGQTGTGNFVGSTSPAITTPNLGTLNDTSSQAMLQFIPSGGGCWITMENTSGPRIQSAGAASNIGMFIKSKGDAPVGFVTEAVSSSTLQVYSGASSVHLTSFAFPTSASSRTVTFPDATGTVLLSGTAINSVPSITFSTTTGVVGTTTNDSAAAGSVGEFISSVVANSSAVSLTSGSNTNITSISLTAGDWDVFGNINWNFTGTGTSYAVAGWISSTSATMPDPELYSALSPNVSTLFAPGNNYAVPVPTFRFSLASTTTIYLSATYTKLDSTATCTASGGIYARRRR